MSTKSIPREVFLSYAPEDESLCLELEKHLSPLKREGLITTWHKGQIDVGTHMDGEISEHLSTASIIVLLLSANFIASDACYGIEMSQAVARHNAGEAYVVPVVLRPMDSWQNTPFGRLAVLPGNGTPVTEWLDTHGAWASVAQGIRSVVQDGKLPPVAVSPSLPPIWNIPYPRNPFFTGRDELLARLATALKTGKVTALSQAQAISGLGGIGKTQIAIEFAYRHRSEYEGVMWTLSDKRESLVSGYITIARLLDLPQKDEQDQAVIIEAVKTWLQTHGSWLLILDNADELSLLPDFLPSTRLGHILLTTRTHSLGGLANCVEVDTLDQFSGMLFLLRRAGLLSLDADLSQAEEVDLLDAQQLWQELGGLPLALDQAGAFIEETQCGVSAYLDLFRTQRAELLKLRGGVLRDHPDSVHTTFALAIAAVAQRETTAVELLQVCAFLHPDAIPEELFRQGASYLGPALESVCTDTLIWNRVLGRLCSYSLLKRQPREQTLSIHRLVQMVLFDTLTEQERVQWLSRVIATLDQVFSQCERATWMACERLVPHALHCASYTQFRENVSLNLASLLYRTANYLDMRRQFREVRPLYEQVLRIREQVLGYDHPDVVGPLGRLAFLHYRREEYEQAIPLVERALRIQEQVLGPDHPKVAGLLQSLAGDYAFQGKVEQAVPLYRRAVRIWEQTLACDDPDNISALEGLAQHYRYQGRYEQAELLYLHVLHIQEQALGPEHPDLVILLVNLAYLSFKQGKMEQTELLCERLLPIQEQVFGSDCIDLAPTLNYLGKIYSEQGKYEQAELVYLRALQIREQLLGTHSHTAETLSDLATLKEAQGHTQEAASLYQRAQSIREHALKAPPSKTVREGYAAMVRAAS